MFVPKDWTSDNQAKHHPSDQLEELQQVQCEPAGQTDWVNCPGGVHKGCDDQRCR